MQLELSHTIAKGRPHISGPLSLILAASLLVAFLPGTTRSQVPTGSIEGVISDNNGAVIPGAKVTVTDRSRGRTFVTKSASGGTYVVNALLPGAYEVKVEAPNFKTEILNVTVDVGKAATGNVSLQVGAISETVSVTAANETAVDVNSSTVSGVVTSRQINSLPMNGRNFLDLAQLEPGVQTLDGGGFDPTKNGYTGVSIAGGEGRTTRIQQDGIDMTDETVGTTVQNLSLEAIHEFQISQSSLDPSTSLSNTGAINIVTKSGTNELHGSGFIYWRDNRFAARVGNDPAPFNREQGGGSLGGRIIKDKLFWFLNYEKNRTRSSAILAPPAPFNIFDGFAAAPFDEQLGTAKVDWNATNRLHVFFRFSHNDNKGVTGFGGSNLSPFQNQDNTNSGVIGADWTLTHFTHSFRVGRVNFANYINPAFPAGIPQVPFQIVVDDTGVTFGPNLLAPQHTLQTDNEFRYDGGWQHGNHSVKYGVDYNRIAVNLFAAFFGNAPLIDTVTGNLVPGLNPADPLSYTPLDIIFGNGLGFFSDKSNHGYQFGGVQNNRVAWYLADTWKLRPNLTINAGVRYELDPGQVNHDLNRPAILDTVAPGESRKVRLDENNFGPTFGIAWDVGSKGTTVIRAGAGVYYETNIFNNVIFERASLLPNTIAPAFPFIFGAPGFNILTGPNGENIFNFNSIAGKAIGASAGVISAAQAQFQTLAAAATANFPNGPISLLPPGGLPGTQNTAGPLFASEFSQPYSVQMNIGVQHKIGQNWLIEANYVRNRGVHTFLNHDYNRVGAASTFNLQAAKDAIAATLSGLGVSTINQAIAMGATIGDFAGNGLGTGGAFPGQNPNFGNLTMISTQGLSTYNGLLVKVNGHSGEFHHFLRSAQWGFSYALSRFNATQGDQAFSALAIDNDCTTCFYGPAGADRTHQFTIHTLFELPWGFHWNTLTRWQSGVPVTLRLANQGNGSGEIFTTDLTGDGTVADVLPGTNLGAFNRSVGSVGALNQLITNFNNNFAGKATPAGQALINSGLFTLAQLQALGGVIQTIPLAPADQVMIDSFWTTDFRISKIIRIKERLQIEPLVEVFNVFNKANYDPPGGITNGPLSGFLSGSPGTANGTAQGQRTNKFGLGVGSFSPGIPRAFQFGVRATF
ncbi:MAG TPA: carboxypeptidase regulatory-like domain-containing protein [Blastocatellia bacterium]|nr:carboxypeptidase regulatory-like domain-containing protein [Blastocatellia bacterium]